MAQSSRKLKNCREVMVLVVEFVSGQMYAERKVLDLITTRKLLIASRTEGTM
jgi:hypothetical protein